MKVRKITNISWAWKIAKEKKKTIMQVKAKDGANLTNDSDILRECNSFYSDLYTTKSTKVTENLEKTIFGYKHHKLNEMDKKKMRGSLN